MTQDKTESIRFYYNGLRVNGERKLTRCCYTLDNRHDGAECVTIYATGYDDLPRDIFPVENDSDSYTDYFEHDRFSALSAIGGLKAANAFPSKKQAEETAAFWNDCYKRNGTYLFA